MIFQKSAIFRGYKINLADQFIQYKIMEQYKTNYLSFVTSASYWFWLLIISLLRDFLILLLKPSLLIIGISQIYQTIFEIMLKMTKFSKQKKQPSKNPKKEKQIENKKQNNFSNQIPHPTQQVPRLKQQINPVILDQITQIMQKKKQQQSKIIAKELTQLFKTEDKDPETITKKLQNIGTQFITNQISVEVSSILNQQKLHKQTTKIEASQNQFIEYLNNFQKMYQTDIKIMQQIEKKKKQLREKRIEAKRKYKVDFQDKNNNQFIFSAEKIGIKYIQKKLKQAVSRNPFFTIDIKQIHEANPSQTYELKTQLNSNKIKRQLKALSRKMKQIYTPLINSGDYVFAIEKYQKQMFENLQKYQRQKSEFQKKLIKQEKKICSIVKEIDLVIVMDTTGSMKSCLQAAKRDSQNIIHKFQASYPEYSINYAFVSYKDHCDRQNLVIPYDFSSADIIEKKIKNVKAQGGGGNYGQAVHDVLKATFNLKWRKYSTKFVFLILDQPPHGNQYKREITRNYQFPNGCCNITLQEIANFFNSNDIHLNMKQCGQDVKNSLTSQVFKNTFRQDLYGVADMKAEQFSEDIVKDLKKKIKQLDEKIQQAANYFTIIKNILLQNVRRDFKQIIIAQQKLQQIEEYRLQLSTIKSYFQEVKRQSEKFYITQTKSRNAKTIAYQSIQILQIAKKNQQIKGGLTMKAIHIQQMIKAGNIIGLAEQLKEQIKWSKLSSRCSLILDNKMKRLYGLSEELIKAIKLQVQNIIESKNRMIYI